jgi:putative endonuclease
MLQRLKTHNDLNNKGWTRKYQPWIQLYFEEYNTKQDALKREKQLKSAKGREFIWKELILKIGK